MFFQKHRVFFPKPKLSSEYRISRKCYNTNKQFYIYYLGNYNNIPVYHYGESCDLIETEFNLKKQLPYYQKYQKYQKYIRRSSRNWIHQI
jgi:hypothetical protein